MPIADLSRKLALPLSDAMLWQPACPTASPFQQYAPFAFWLTQAFKPRSFVALGRPASVAQLSVCQAVQRLALGTRCYGVDLGLESEASDVQRLAWHEAQYRQSSRILHQPLPKALSYFRPGEIDWLHIDDLEILGTMKEDWGAWQARLSPRAILTVHGTAPREPALAFAFLEDLRRRYPAVEFVHGDGLTLLCMGPKHNKAIKQLLRAFAEARLRQPLQACFARLGQGCMDACKPEETARALGPVRAASETPDNKQGPNTEDLKARLTRAETALAEAQARLHATQKLASGETERANRLEAACTTAQQAQKAAEMQAANAKTITDTDHDNRIAALQMELKQAQATMQQQARRLDDRFRELGTLTALLEERNKELAAARAVAAARPASNAEVLSPAAQQELVARSGLFDAEWYLATYPDVARQRESALQHFMLHGAAEGRNPSASFDTTWYCRTYPDVHASRLNPLLHYIRIGRKEGRETCARHTPAPRKERAPEPVHG